MGHIVLYPFYFAFMSTLLYIPLNLFISKVYSKFCIKQLIFFTNKHSILIEMYI